MPTTYFTLSKNKKTEQCILIIPKALSSNFQNGDVFLALFEEDKIILIKQTGVNNGNRNRNEKHLGL
jgi:hypothetical protein